MKKYETYKHSGIDWLGEIPSHWDSKKMKYLFIDFSKKNMPNETLLSVTQNQGVVPRDWVENRMVMPSGNLESFKYIEKGDFCISLRSFEGGLEYCFHSGIVSPAYTVLKGIFKHYDGYYKYLFKSQIFIDELQLSIVGIREGKNISYELLKYNFLPIPPIHEQEAIAAFLDEKCGKIDALVEIKSQQIEKLKELRQVKIHQAVTKGLDANVALKDSGIDWIGDIPKHWEVKRLKNLATNLNNRRIPIESTIRGQMNNCIYDYYGATGVIDKVDDYIFDEETILIAEDGANLLLRNIQLIYKPKGKYWVNNHAHILKPHEYNNLDFLAFAMEDFDYTVYISGAAQPKLTKEKVMNIWLIVPPLSDQEAIVAYLEEVTSKIDQAIAQKQEQIEKLKQYKQSLINEVVTGKVKVC